MTNELLEAYLTSTYWVLEPPPLALHVDSASGATAQWLGEGCAGKVAYLTPCNPRSKALTTAVNAELMEQAQATVRAMGLNSAKGVSMGTDGRWCEPGMLIWPISLHKAMDLARAWDQNAFIWLDEVWTPRLMMADTEPTCEASLP